MALCVPISSTTNDFEYISTTYFTNQPTTFSETVKDVEIPSTTVYESTHNPEIIPIDPVTEFSNRINLDQEPIEPHPTEPNYLNVYISNTERNEDEREEVIDEISNTERSEDERKEVFDEIIDTTASTVLLTETPDNSNLIPTSSTEKEREITTKPYVGVQTPPVRKFTRISKTTRTPYRKRVEITTERTLRYLTIDEMRAKHDVNSKFKFTKNLFYILCPVLVAAIIVGIFYVKRINEI
ncbi:unnamed protein product [Diamesa tonsa]